MNHTTMNIKLSLVTLLGVLALGVIAATGSWTVANAAPIGSPCVSDGTCDNGLVCPRSGTWVCSNLTLRYLLPETRADRIYSFVNSNSADATYPLTIYTCLSTKAACQTQPVTNTAYWTYQGFAGQPWFQQLNLRPSLSYTLTVQGQEHGAILNYDQAGFLTWPGYAPKPTDSDPGCNATTGRCARNISWTTIFSGDTYVAYGQNPPTWNFETTHSLAVNVTNADVSLSGTIFAVGDNGLVMKHVGSNWTLVNAGGGTNYNSVSVFNDQNIWVSGAAASLFHTSDGNSWSGATIPGAQATENFRKIIATSPTTALVLSSPTSGSTGTKVYYYNGSNWSTVFTDATISCTGMTALSVYQAWISCSGGVVKYSQDAIGTAPWNTTTIPGSPTLLTIATRDGATIWAGGGNSLFKSTNGGGSFTAITSVPAGVSNYKELVTDSPSSVYFADGTSVYHYSDAPSPSWNIDVSAGTVLGSPIHALAQVKNQIRMYVLGNGNRAAYLAMPFDSSYHDYNYVTANFDAPGTHTAALTDLDSNRTYYYAIKSTDATGTVSISEFGGSFTTPLIDPTPPTVTMNALPPITNTCPLAVSGTAADTAPGTVKTIRLTIDGNAVTPVNGLTNWSASIPCSQLTNGSHTITVRSNDGPNDSSPVSATVVFDNVVPTISITAASPVTTASVTASGTATDTASQVTQIQYALNGSASRTTVPITAGATVPWSAVVSGLSPGSNTINVYARDAAGNEGTNAATVVYNVPSFTVTAAAPTTQTRNIGDVVTFTINVNSQNTFTRPVGLAVSGIPAPATTSFAPPTVTPPSDGTGTSTLTITTLGLSSGTYVMTVTGTDGATGQQDTTQVTLILNVAPDFSLSSLNATQSVQAGNPATFTLHIAGSTTYNYPNPPGMSFTHGALPAGVTVVMPSGPLPNNPSLGASTDVDFVFTTTTDFASQGIVITATDGTKTHTFTFTLAATPAPDFGLTLNAASRDFTAGPITQAQSSNFFNLTVTALNGFTGAVALSVVPATVYPSVTTTFSPPTLTPSSGGSLVTINIHVDSGVACPPPVPPAPPATCSFPIQFRGQAGTLNKTVSATLVVTPDTTPPVISNPSTSVDYNSVTVSWQTDEPADSKVVIYPDATQNDLGPVIASDHQSAFCTSTCHSLTLPLPTPSTVYYYSITSVDQAYGGGNASVMKLDAGEPLHFMTTAAPDLTQPVIVLDTPADGTAVLGSVVVSAHASDNNPLSKIFLRIGSTASPSLVDTSFPCADVTCAISYQWNTMQAPPLVTFPNDTYRVTVWAVSSSGQVTSTVDYSRSVDQVHTVTVDNDTTPPQILCLPGQTICEPVATNLLCSAGNCSIDIIWRTDDRSTSEVDYGLAVDCATPQTKTLPDGSTITLPCTYTDVERYDSTNPSDGSPLYTDHRVSLSGLEVDRLYHYRITSCNASNLCTN